MADYPVLPGDRLVARARGKLIAEKTVDRKGFYIECIIFEMIDQPEVGHAYAIGAAFVVEDYQN
jgi:hypothetical protein